MPDDKPTRDSNTCPVKMSDHKPCGRSIYNAPEGVDEQPLCLMHSHDPNKLKDEFQQEIDAILKGNSEYHRSNHTYDFHSFVFPELSLEDVTLDKAAVFRKATFNKEANFIWVTFKNRANFSGATFKKDAYFAWATFTERAVFSRATFTEEIDFTEATFIKQSNFSNATFTKDAYFNRATFNEHADFETTFTRDADFSGATFKKGESFDHTWFLGRSNFRHTELLEPRKVRFRQVNQPRKTWEEEEWRVERCEDGLRVYFSDCNVEEVVFEDVNWDTRHDRIVLQDELDIHEGKNDTYELVAIAYRRLTNNFEKSRDYDLAEDCFVGLMEMKRLDPKQPRGVRLVTSLYKFASEYGSNYIRALKVLGVLLLASWILYALPWSGLEPVGGVDGTYVRPRIRAAWHRRDAFLYSLDVATFQRVAAYKTTAWFGHGVRILETLLVPGQIALLFLALRRRFRR